LKNFFDYHEIKLDAKVSNISNGSNQIITISCMGMLKIYDEFTFECLKSVKIAKGPVYLLSTNMSEIWVYGFDKVLVVYDMIVKSKI
jgi:hypothetical protein